MLITGDVSKVRARRRADGEAAWGLVPTMGYLHEGHLSLVRAARGENERLAVSLFVNPAQFGAGEDLDAYPRNLQRDLDLLDAEGVDLVFTPTTEQMYPPGFQTWVTVEHVSRPLEGHSRPTHFRGVATVVAKLFNIVQPARAYFGQKDAQQVVVLWRMVEDLNFSLELVVRPTVREADGLAMSSRNANLSPEQRAAAPVLHRALGAAEAALRDGERRGEVLVRRMAETVAVEPLARLDYASAADPASLRELEVVEGGVLLSLAVFFGSVRLIDNLLLQDLRAAELPRR